MQVVCSGASVGSSSSLWVSCIRENRGGWRFMACQPWHSIPSLSLNGDILRCRPAALPSNPLSVDASLLRIADMKPYLSTSFSHNNVPTHLIQILQQPSQMSVVLIACCQKRCHTLASSMLVSVHMFLRNMLHQQRWFYILIQRRIWFSIAALVVVQDVHIYLLLMSTSRTWSTWT